MRTTALAPPRPSLSDAPSSAPAGHHATPEQDDERALLDRVALQDQQAFATLYERSAAPVRRYLRRCLGQADLIDEVLQEVMLVLWQRPAACPPTVPLLAWLCGIARHKARKARAHSDSHTRVPPGPPEDPPTAPDVLLLRQEEEQALEQLLDTLPFSERAVVRLYLQHGAAYQAIAAQLDLPLSTVRTRFWRACHRLRAHVVAADAASPHASLPRARSPRRASPA